jgi:shikimate kinase
MIELDERKRWDQSQNIVLIGPGGSGKSSLGVELAPLLNQGITDRDSEFNRQIGNVGEFIRKEGYEAYKLRNSALAALIMSELVTPTLFVTSSGFLTPDNPPTALEANRLLVAACYSICLLPSRNMEEAVGVILERQARRSFTRDRAHEESTIRARYPIYAQEGDLLVFSTAPSCNTAEAIAHRLFGGS